MSLGATAGVRSGSCKSGSIRLIGGIFVNHGQDRWLCCPDKALRGTVFTEDQIHASTDGILAADIVGIRRDPGVNASNHIGGHAYGDAFVQSRASVFLGVLV